MHFLLEALDEIAAEIFGSLAHLRGLDLDVVFVDTTSTYWEVDVSVEVADLAEQVDDDGDDQVSIHLEHQLHPLPQCPRIAAASWSG